MTLPRIEATQLRDLGYDTISHQSTLVRIAGGSRLYMSHHTMLKKGAL